MSRHSQRLEAKRCFFVIFITNAIIIISNIIIIIVILIIIVTIVFYLTSFKIHINDKTNLKSQSL